MKIGALRSRVTLQQKTRTSDGIGGATVSWTDVATVWANVKPVSSKEKYQAERLSKNASHAITIRHRADVNEQFRVLHNSKTFAVDGYVTDEEDKEKYTILYCSEGEE